VRFNSTELDLKDETFSFLFCAVGEIKNMIHIKYIFKENRKTDYYDVGKIWFNKYVIVWNWWLLNKHYCIIKYKKI
jgi:hypothetical protein